jgi:hypothetical protein
MSTVPCPELESLRSDYELTLRAGAEIDFPLVGSSIETTEPLATALFKSGARIRRTMAAKRLNAHKESCRQTESGAPKQATVAVMVESITAKWASRGWGQP